MGLGMANATSSGGKVGPPVGVPPPTSENVRPPFGGAAHLPQHTPTGEQSIALHCGQVFCHLLF